MSDEVLVHISTPATRQNDDLYRSLASAYVEFEPHRSHSYVNRMSDDETPRAPYGAGVAATTIDESILSTSKESYGSFPSHLSSEGHVKGYYQKPPSGLSDSGSLPSSGRLVRLEHIHLKWKEKITPRSSFTNREQRARAGSEDTEDDPDTAFIEDTQLGAQALQSQLQMNGATAYEDTSEDELDAERECCQVRTSSYNDTQGDVLGTKMAVPSSSYSTVPARDPTPSSMSLDTQNSEEQLNSFNIDQQHTKDAQEHLIRATKVAETLDWSSLEAHAFPPAPTVSTAQPGKLPSQITKHLAAMKAQNPAKFRPSIISDLPRPDIRGYWSIRCSHWPLELQYEFWKSMQEHVRSGRLGWGTTLHRDGKVLGSLGHVRLYCWGEVVEHMWLLIWLCSNGKIASSDLKWYDANGHAVITIAEAGEENPVSPS